jgi:hypothetical protein
MMKKAALRPPKVRGMAGSRSFSGGRKMGLGAHFSPPYNRRDLAAATKPLADLLRLLMARR